jgi:PTH1 family peptidyl-tRNA hydrolase
MRLIIGLGNPGPRYEHTRHNIGARIVKALAKQQGVLLKRGLFSRSLTARTAINGRPVILAVPLTYMNLSGQAAGALARKHRIPPEDILVVYDDLDLEPGKIRIRPEGSAGGHNGMKSVIASLGSQEFCRLRIGVGRPAQAQADIAEYVLSPFLKSEQPSVQDAIDAGCSCIESWATDGIEKTMNLYNR